MKIRILFGILFISILGALLLVSPNANAQNNDVNQIINDIFNGRVPDQNDKQGDTPNTNSLIDNIPVEVRFNAGTTGLAEQATLILSAYAPPPPNVRRAAPLLIGETRLLLTGLNAPLHLVIAAPQTVTSTLDYARIEAKIIDNNGNSIFELRNSAEYRGREAAVLTLNRIGSQSSQPPFEPMIDAVHGTVSLNGVAPNFRGSNLVVRLVEDGLAGGQNHIVIGETRQSLDQKSGPFNFNLEPGLKPRTNGMPLAFEAWIEDWAGRKTHILTPPLPYNGTTHTYQIRLDTLAASQPAPQPNNKPTIVTSPVATPRPLPIDTSQEILVRGQAIFNAHKGLPAGSVLIATLERTEVINSAIRTEALGQVRVSLDGLSGAVNFDVPTQQSRLTNTHPTPLLRVRVEDANGKLFFSNPSGKRLQRGMNTVNLIAAPGY